MAISANIQNSVNIMRRIKGLGKNKWGIFSLEQKMPKLPRRSFYMQIVVMNHKIQK